MHNESASIFLFPRFSVSNEPVGFARELWSMWWGWGLDRDRGVGEGGHVPANIFKIIKN